MRSTRRIATAVPGVAAAMIVLASILAAPAISGVPAPDLPVPNSKWDYQIGDPYAPRAGVSLVSRDREARPFAAGYTICYVNAYQTQESEVRWWKNHHRNLLLRHDGEYVVDGFWGEILFDIRTPAKRQALARIVGRWIAGCGDDGFDAIEPDNLDSWTRSKKLITKDDAFAYAALLIDRAHSEGLPIGQKNAAGQTARGEATGFDFAIAEECGRWRECRSYTAAYGDQVYVIEYRRQDFRFTCNHWADQLSIVLRNLQVTAPGSKNYVYRAC